MAAVAGPVPFSPPTITAPGYDAFAITPSDSTNFDIMCRCIYVGVGGNITLVTSKGTTILFKNVPTGAFIPICAIRVNNTATAATDMVGII